jgi:hypothetical protein
VTSVAALLAEWVDRVAHQPIQCEHDTGDEVDTSCHAQAVGVPQATASSTSLSLGRHSKGNGGASPK